jgi:ankyrin repeat protein
MTCLYEAAHAGDVDVLKKLLEEEPLLLDRTNITNEVSDNPLHIACLLGHAGFAKEILQYRPNLARELNGQGLTPLHLAASQGHLAVVLELLQVNTFYLK